MNPQAFGLLVLSNVLGGASYVGASFALRGLSSYGVVFWRTLAGGLLFLPVLARGNRERVSRQDWLDMAVVGVFGLAAPLLLGTIGQTLSSATNASLLVGMEPVSIVVLSALFLGEPLTALKMGAIVLGLGGSALIVLQGIPFLTASLTPHLAGDSILFLHGILWSLYSVIGKRPLRRVDPLFFTAVTTIFALVPFSAAAALTGLRFPPASALGGVLFLAVGATFAGTLAWVAALKAVPASQTANFIFLQPLVGVLLGVFLQKEAFSSWSAAGGALILAGVFAATRRPREEEVHEAESVPV